MVEISSIVVVVVDDGSGVVFTIICFSLSVHML